MKIIKNLLLSTFILLGLFLPNKVESQIGVGPAPYCMPLYSQIPCNQPNPSNTPGNFINDFIHGYNTNGATTNIVNNTSGCNAQNLSGTKNYRLWGCEHYLVCSPGQVITSNFRSGNTFAQGCAVFVDWNNDGIYNAANFTGVVPGGERVTRTAGVPGAGVWSAMPAWTVPNVPAGIYRMRVRCAYATSGLVIQPCNNYGYGETEEYYVYVNTQPAGVITATLGSNSPVCTGNSLSLTATASGTAANTYTYTWSGPNSFTSSAINPTIAATTSLQSGVYTVTINPGACPITQTIQVSVNQTPTITSISNDGPVCQGGVINITLNNTTAGVTSYSWTGPNGYTSNIQSPSINSVVPSNSGSYTVNVVNTFTNGTCSSVGYTSFAVVPIDQITTVSNQTLCQGTNLFLTSTVNGASGILWQGPNSYTSSLQNPSILNSNPTHSGDYTVTATFTSNQTTLTCSSSAVSNVSIVPMFPVMAVSNNNVCEGGIGTFSALASGGAPIYNWAGPNGFFSNNQINNINNITPAATGNYTVSAIFSIGTVSCMTSNFTQLNVVPMGSITVVPNIDVCKGQGAVLTATSNGAISYQWTGPNNFSVSTPTAVFANLTSTYSGVYTVTALYTNGSINCYNSNTSILNVKPDIQFTLSPMGQLCYNQSLLINGPAGATSYTWTGPGINVNSQSLYLPTTTTNNIGTYSLIVDLNGCKTYGATYVDVLDPIKWKYEPGEMTVCKGQNFTVTTMADGGSGNYAYTWNPYFGIAGPTGSVQVGTGVGTTIYQISVYDISCPQYTITTPFKLNVLQPPVPKLAVEDKLCEPYCAIFNSKIGDESEYVSYTFNGQQTYYGDSTKICLPAGTHVATVTALGLNGCTGTYTYGPIVVYPKPIADFTWDPKEPNTLSESVITLYPVNRNTNYSYTWELGPKDDTTTYIIPTVKFTEPGKYPISMMVTTEHGCRDTITKVIKVDDEFIMYIPNAFTPNGDGNNDTFQPKGLGIKSFTISIFDRWGREIYFNRDGKGWDGTFKGSIVQDGVYIYTIVAIDNKSGKKEFKGHVTLMK